MVLASKVHPIPLKFLSKEGQNSTLRAAILNQTEQPLPLIRDVNMFNETSGRVTWALGTRLRRGGSSPPRQHKQLETDGKFKTQLEKHSL